ncbi:hypothetical protein RvY_09628-2 [Ramazzottius varieornatus]|nr:hypothetical protein RvY_09628-2 [Ramazzottius varieornatus]
MLDSLVNLLLVVNRSMEFNDSNVLFTCTLLTLNKSRCTLDADNQATSYFGIECSRVTSLLYSQDTFYPRSYFVTGGIRRFVQVNEATTDVFFNVSLMWRASER